MHKRFTWFLWDSICEKISFDIDNEDEITDNIFNFGCGELQKLDLIDKEFKNK